MQHERLTIIRHLKDTDNLLANGTNNPLEPTGTEAAINLGNQLYQQAIQEGYWSILLIASPKIRVTQTAELIKQGIMAADPNFKTGIIVNPNLRELDQGKLKLPDDYQSGTYFAPLKEAWSAFWNESFIVSHDLTYRFGSSFAQGELKYPNFSKYFEYPGESYKDETIRLYTAIHEFGKKINHNCRIKPIVVTHGAPLAIFRELELIANDVLMEKLDLRPGQLVQMSWDYFAKRKTNQHPDYGQACELTITSLFDNRIRKLLEQEINYLKEL